MQELIAIVSPSSVPCSASGDEAQDSGPITLQVSLFNVTTETIELNFGANDPGALGTPPLITLTFPVDQGGVDSTSALILSDYSTTPGTGMATPVSTVNAVAAPGTPWSIVAVDGSPATFIAVPSTDAPIADGTGPGAGNNPVYTLAGNGSLTFLFSDILVDEVPGVAFVNLTTSFEGDTIDTSPSASISKTPAGLGITGFTASPLLCEPEGTLSLAWATTGASQCALSWTPDEGVTPSTGSSLTNTGTVPLQVDGLEPIDFTVHERTQFTLTASGDGTVIDQSVIVDLARPELTLNSTSLTVLPSEEFTLTWSTNDPSQLPTISWSNVPGVYITDLATNTSIGLGEQLAYSGQATVTILVPTEFSIGLSGSNGASQTCTVITLPVGAVTATADPDLYTQPNPGNALGVIDVVTTNATGITITGPTPFGTPLSFAVVDPQHGQPASTSCAAVSSTVSGSYVVQATGFTPSGTQPSTTTVAVNAKVALLSFTASQTTIKSGQSTLLSWSSYAATQFSLSDGYGTVWSFGPDTTQVAVTPVHQGTTYSLVALGYTGSDPAPPSSSVEVTVDYPKVEKEVHVKGEALIEKSIAMLEKIPRPGERTPSPLTALGDAVDNGHLPPSDQGTQRALIPPAQRPQPAPPVSV